MRKIFFLVILFLAFLLLMTGCSNLVAPEGAIRFDPPAQYKVWWDAIQPCVNKDQKRHWNDIEWYHVNDIVNPSGAVGMAQENRIYISDWYVYDQQGNFLLSPTDAWVSRHELVHSIDKIGPDHPYDPFYKCQLMNTQQPAYSKGTIL